MPKGRKKPPKPKIPHWEIMRRIPVDKPDPNHDPLDDIAPVVVDPNYWIEK